MFTSEVTTVDDPPADAPGGWDEFAVLTPVPPDESFWRKHNRHLEMPTSLVLSLLIMAAAFAVFAVLMLYAINPGPEKAPPPISMVDGGGPDEAGLGNVDAGQSGSDLKKAEATTPAPSLAVSQTPATDLPEVRTPDTPTPETDLGDRPSEAKPSDYGQVADLMSRKLLPGSGGNRDGQGRSGIGAGAGETGSGDDITKARSLRWVIKFKTVGGQDYLDQLRALGAVVLVPTPENREKFFIFRDLKDPKPGVLATDEEILAMDKQVQFLDADRTTLATLEPVLHLDFRMSLFHAVFPAGLEQEMAAKERAYRGRSPQDIASTTFQAVKKGGAYHLEVTAQTARR